MQGGMKDCVKEGGVLVLYLYTCKIVKKKKKKKKNGMRFVELSETIYFDSARETATLHEAKCRARLLDVSLWEFVELY